MKNLYLLLLIMFALATGCANLSVISYPLNEEMNTFRLSEEYNSNRFDARFDQINVNLVCPDIFGCYEELVRDESEKSEKGAFRCLAAPLHAVTADEDMKRYIEEQGSKKRTVLYFTYFNDVAKEMLEKSLKSYYNNVNITLTSSAENLKELNSKMEMDYYRETLRTGEKRIFVNMAALDKDGNILFDVTGSGINEWGKGHIYWLLPMAILTLPIGLIIEVIILNKKDKEMISKSAMDAIDDACRKFADKSIEFASRGITDYKLMVYLE